MTDAQWLTVVIGCAGVVSTIILGILSVVIGMLNLVKKK
jgi:hypothetical protein